MDFFFLFSKIFTILIFPIPLIILIGIYYTLFKISGFKNKIYTFQIIFLLWLCSSFFFSQFLVLKLEEKFPPVEIEKLEENDVAIVLGGMIHSLPYHKNRVELLSSAERLTEAVNLYQKKKIKKILFTGGSGILFATETSEASFAKKFFLDIGVKEEDIILEDKSRNTIENAKFTKKILDEKKFKKILLITSAFHMQRSSQIFKKQEIEFIAYPVDYRASGQGFNWEVFIPSVGALETTTISIKEWIGILVYEYAGFL